MFSFDRWGWIGVYETLAKRHHSSRSFRTASRWSQFVSLTMAQLSNRNSLRDIVDNMWAQIHHLYHLESARLSRSNLSRNNEDKPYALYEELFGKLLSRCRGGAGIESRLNFGKRRINDSDPGQKDKIKGVSVDSDRFDVEW